MSSTIHYKFRSAKEYDSYRFEGSGIPVWQLKAEIIESKKLEKSTDFDLVITNAQMNTDYTDDMQIIPRNTSVVVRRVPVAPGTGKSYNPAREARNMRSITAPSATPTVAPTGPLSAEDADIQSVIQQGSLKFDLQASANAASALQPGRRQMMTFRPRPTSSALPPPPNYVCFRCGQKGHFINHCPTNSDPNFDKPRIKKTTGIPKSFLKPIEGGDAVQARAADPTLAVMITAEGEAVIARPKEDEWKRLVESKSLQDDAHLAQLPVELSCVNEHLLINPVLLPCCGASYCEACARLLRVCGKCTSAFDHGKLQIDADLKMKVDAFINGEQAAPQQQQQQEDTKSQISKADSAPIGAGVINNNRNHNDDEYKRMNNDYAKRDDYSMRSSGRDAFRRDRQVSVKPRNASHEYNRHQEDLLRGNQRDYDRADHDRDRHYRRRSRSRSRSRSRDRGRRRSSYRSRSRSPSYDRHRSHRRSRH